MKYEKPGVNWGQYTKVWIKPFELWKSDEPDSKLGKLSEKDQQYLVDLAYDCVTDDLNTEFEIVNQAGPGVLVIHMAITDAKKSKPVLNLISSIHPVGLAINYGKQIATGQGVFVGGIAIEGDMRDGSSNELLAAFADRRAGSKAWRSKFNGSWGDVKLAFHWWTQRFAERLAEEARASRPRPTGDRAGVISTAALLIIPNAFLLVPPGKACGRTRAWRRFISYLCTLQTHFERNLP